MSVSIEIRFKEGDEIGHHLFVRRHATRVEQGDRPSGRTLLVCNCPPWCPPDAVRRLFGRFGAIESVQTQLKPGNREEKSVETAGRFTVNYIVFANEEAATKVMAGTDSGVMVVNTVENPVVHGYSLFCAEYNQSFPNVKQLQDDVNEWMKNFDQQKEATIGTEEGWTKVGKKKTQKMTEEEQEMQKKKSAKKRKKNQLVNFYQFQIRETKKQKIVELREKFEADKKKIERMKAERKFKPMSH